MINWMKLKREVLFGIVIIIFIALTFLLIKNFTGRAITENNYCKDSDGGPDVYLQGTAYGELNSVPYAHQDFCIDDERLLENTCQNDQRNSFIASCNQARPGYVCQSGACVQKIDIQVIEFESRAIEYGNAYYCCQNNTGFQECFFTFNDIFCNTVNKTFPYLTIFNNENGSSNETTNNNRSLHSIFYLKEYLVKEAEKYNPRYPLPIINIQAMGPFRLERDPPSRDRNDIFSNDVQRFFENETQQRNISFNNSEIVVFVFFNNQNETSPGFVSFTEADHAFLSLDVSDYNAYSDIKVGNFIHETLHALGVVSFRNMYLSDLYTVPCANNSYAACCKIPSGLANQTKIPLYPQDKACIMCGFIPLAQDGNSASYIDVTQTAICDFTARELGWLN